MKVVIADPPALEKAYDHSYPNVGVLYVLGYLRNAHPEVQTLYLEARKTLEQHLQFLRDHQPAVYGISFTSKTFRLAARTIAAVREALPNATIVCGGPHATALPEKVLNETKADVVVMGEGEVTFADLVDHISRNEGLHQVPGIVHRHNGEVVRTSRRDLIRDLDTIPFPAWDLVDHRNYPGMHLKMQPVESSLVISRGCPYDCTFCSNPVWKLSKPWLRYRSHQNILEEIDLLYKAGIREIYFSSDEMNFNLTWAEELLDAIIAMKREDLYFQANLRVDKVTPSFAKKLHEARFWLLHLGMESANDRVLKGLDKRITVKQIEDATSALSQAGIKLFGFMMLYNVWESDGQLQFETSEEVDTSIRFCLDLLKTGRLHYMSWQFCTPLPGARLYEIANRHNLLIADEHTVWEQFDEHYVAMQLPGISRASMQWKIKKGILIKDWYMLRSGRISWRHLWRARENILALLRFKQ